MATGVDKDGDKTVKKLLGQRLIEYISDPALDATTKLRLIMIFLISQDGIDATTRTKIFKEAAISAEQSQAVLNLNNLGVTLQSSAQKAKGRLKAEQLDKNAKLAKEQELDMMRFVPLLHDVMAELALGKLSTNAKDGYPYAGGAPKEAPTYESRVAGAGASRSGAHAVIQTRSQREAKREEAKRGGAAASASAAAASSADAGAEEPLHFRDDGPKFIVYSAGGCTYSEVRSAYEVANQFGCQMLFGANRVLTASKFIDELMCRPDAEHTPAGAGAAAADADDVKVDVK
jgi:syntaxin-binding protein 1